MKTKTFILWVLLGLYISLHAQALDKKTCNAKSIGQSGIVTWTPYICSDAAGNFVITWAEEDDVTSKYDIFAQRFSIDGTALGDQFRVNEVQGTYYIWSEHAICSDDSGNFVIVWADERNGGELRLHNVYAQRYASDGTPLSGNFRVNDDAGAGSARWPSVACDSLGHFVVAWVDQRTYKYAIHAQCFSSDGMPQGGNFKVSAHEQGSALYPCVSVNSSGQFVIVWEDNRNEGWTDDIYAQRYAADGTAQGVNFKVNDDQVVEDQASATVCIDDAGRFVVAWTDGRNGSAYPDIYVQRYENDGGPLGGNVKINDNQEDTKQYSSYIAGDNAGNYTIAWLDERNGVRDIYAQRFANDGSALGTNFMVNDNQTVADQYSPTLSMYGSGNLIITWEDGRTGEWDIFAQQFNSDGTPIGGNFKVNARTTYVDEEVGGLVPAALMLGQNYPNPFNPYTQISYALHACGTVVLTLYDMLGCEIRTLVNAFQAPGAYTVRVDGSALPSGVYLYTVKLNGRTCETRKMMLLR